MFSFSQQPQPPLQNQNNAFAAPNPQPPSTNIIGAQGFSLNNQYNQSNSQSSNFMNQAASSSQNLQQPLNTQINMGANNQKD